jgi:GMP synthase-like glutamine amidotransferase
MLRLTDHALRLSVCPAHYSKSALHIEDNPCTGICFGHQIVARALGGECVPNGGKWEVAITEVALTDLGQRIFGVPTIVR